MRDTIAFIFLLLLNATFVRTAPATPGAGSDSGTSFIQLSNMTSGFPNATSSLSGSFCPGSGNDLNSVRTHMIAIPGTTTILIIIYCPSLPIDPNIVRRTIATARIHMSDQLHNYGDKPLLASDDPYFTPLVEGVNCELKIYSQRVPRTQVIPNHLTYQIALNALQGLFTFLYTENHAVSAVSEILDPGLTASMIRVGVISISPLEGAVDES